VEEALKKNSDNTHPYIILLGSHTEFTSAVGVCGKKVITSEIGQFILSAILTLLAISYAYDLSYNPSVQQVLEFIQEMVIGDSLPSTRKVSTAFSNLCRAINCIQQKMACEEPPELETEDSDATQACHDFN
jgi:hypothetical protein